MAKKKFDGIQVVLLILSELLQVFRSNYLISTNKILNFGNLDET